MSIENSGAVPHHPRTANQCRVYLFSGIHRGLQAMGNSIQVLSLTILEPQVNAEGILSSGIHREFTTGY